MSPSSTGEGTKIAQAAKDLNVTSVTIRRYLSEFNIETTIDENGVKVLPDQAMEELKTIRKLKEEGAANPRVLEVLEEGRTSSGTKKPKPKSRATSKAASKVKESVAEGEEVEIQSESITPEAPEEDTGTEEVQSSSEAESSETPRSKHSLTCQTCGKVFEHMNPRLRDCLDCYRTKRKERRRGGDRHKNVIQHPLAQQVASKNTQQQTQTQASQYVSTAKVVSTVRNYRKAIEDTRHITSNLKRRLERPDLTDGERRWLEQIYAYQLILHQGWRHLSEYKNANQQTKTTEPAESPAV